MVLRTAGPYVPGTRMATLAPAWCAPAPCTRCWPSLAQFQASLTLEWYGIRGRAGWGAEEVLADKEQEVSASPVAFLRAFPAFARAQHVRAAN